VYVFLAPGQKATRTKGHIQKATGQKATGQKATATQLRVYFPAHKYQLTRSLFFSRLAYTPHV